MNIKDKLVNAVTRFDARQSKGKYWNPHALPIYLDRVDAVCSDIDAGASPRQAIIAGFTDRICDACLKAIGEGPYTRQESFRAGIVYTPVKAVEVV